MEVMLAKKKPMSELASPLKIYPQVLENVRVTDKKAAQYDPAVQEAVNTVVEALGDTGRILVRESSTEPVVRVMVAAPVLLDGLSLLEYRGYDSAGLAVRDGENLAQVVKAKGRLSNLIEKTDGGKALKGTCGIGHTR